MLRRFLRHRGILGLVCRKSVMGWRGRTKGSVISHRLCLKRFHSLRDEER